MKQLGILFFVLYVVSCTSPHKKIGQASPFVEKLVGVSLTEKVNAELKKGYSNRPWQWRGRNANGAPPQSFVPPRFVNDKDVLIGTLGGGILLFDSQLGSKIWELEIPIGVGAQVAYDTNFVFVAGMDRVLRKLDLSTGRMIWKKDLSAESTGGILLTQKILYVTVADNSLWAIDVKSGQSLWTYKRPSPQKAALWSLRGSSTPKLSPNGAELYVGFSDGYFVSLNSQTGDTIWERNFERPGRFIDADVEPVLSLNGRQIFLSLVDGDLVSLDAKTGVTQWKLPNAAHSAPLLDEVRGVLYYGTNDQKLVRASMQSGSIFWTISLGDRGVAATPAFVGEKYLAISTTRYGFILFDQNSGREVYSDYLGSGLLAPPVVQKNKILLLSPQNDLLVYRIKTSS